MLSQEKMKRLRINSHHIKLLYSLRLLVSLAKTTYCLFILYVYLNGENGDVTTALRWNLLQSLERLSS